MSGWRQHRLLAGVILDGQVVQGSGGRLEVVAVTQIQRVAIARATQSLAQRFVRRVGQSGAGSIVAIDGVDIERGRMAVADKRQVYARGERLLRNQPRGD